MKKIILFTFLSFFIGSFPISSSYAQDTQKNSSQQANHPYAFEANLIEVMFTGESRVRMRNGTLIDLTTRALQGVDEILNELKWHEWQRLCDIPESTIDNWETNGERNSGRDVYNLNNIYRLKIPEGLDTWKLSERLEALPGIYSAKPVPKPVALPTPGNYQSQQGYLNPAINIPTGVDALYSWTTNGGTGTGVTICDLEYSWNYNHADITKAPGSQINPNTITDPFNDNNHGTAVLGEMFADNNGWGTTGICFGANLKTCGTFWNNNWNPAGAISYAISSLSAGDIILIEQQWDYTGNGGYVPIEWYSNTTPGGQTNNAVYAAIVNAVANGISVVEAGGNGNINTGTMSWLANSGAIIVGAGGGFTSTNLKRIVPGSWGTSYGPRYDLQGWGENVFTTGYGTYYNSQGPNYYYRADFNGTSSASPVVTGALACVEGYYFANVSTTIPTPAYWRNLLVTNGTAQVTPPSGNIGPRPDIKATILSLPVATMDFGDAPDGPYPTLLASNGARHANTGLSLGPLIDVEFDGQSNVPATGDDINPLIADDEDGVIFTSPLIAGQTATVQVIANMPCVLNAWVDFNKVNSWADIGEQIFTNVMLAGGINFLTFAVPANAVPLFTYARFRVSGQGGLTYYGPAANGEVEDYQVLIQQQEIDFGDAPDPTYPTLLASNGARHLNAAPNIMIGVLKDFEPDGQPSIPANGDDLNNLQDEDGVIFATPLMVGQPAMVNVISNFQGALLQAWIDFNADGDWADAGEQIATNFVTIAGGNNVPFMVPGNATVGISYARFRLSTIQNLGFSGSAPNGEVEDFKVSIVPDPLPDLDFGDAPDPGYPTLLASNGARHTIDQVTFLGSLIDGEPDGQPIPAGMGDDIGNFPDEDGVTFMWPMAKGNPCKLKVKASVGNAFLNCWIDFNGNGSWAEPNEHVFVDLNLLAGDNYLTFITPQNATAGPSFARFRFSHQQALSYNGPASDGEVEDYVVNINKFVDIKWQQLPDPLLPGLHVDGNNIKADDWICDGSIVTDIHWWGNYEMLGNNERRGQGIQDFLINIYSNSQCTPNALLKSYVVPFPTAIENTTGSTNNEGSLIYKYDYILPEPFLQNKDTTYWLSVQAISNDLNDPAVWRWQEANRWLFPINCGAEQNLGAGWQLIQCPFPPVVKYTDFAFQLTTMVLDTLYVRNQVVTPGQDNCYDAHLVIIVAGNGTTFTVQSGGMATMISGQQINYLPGTTVLNGGYMHGYITTIGEFCSAFKTSALESTMDDPAIPEPDEAITASSSFRIYPNPTTGRFVLEVNEKGEVMAEIYGMYGKRVMYERLYGQNRYELSLEGMPPGVYILRFISGTNLETVKIIKR